MEQEETKTTAAAGVEMPPEAESWVLFGKLNTASSVTLK